MRASRRSILLFTLSFVSAMLLMGATAQAQPPWVVDWLHDGVLAHGDNGVHLNPVTNGTLVIAVAPWPMPACSGPLGVFFTPSGDLLAPCCYDVCMEVYGISQMFSGAILTPNGTLIFITIDIGVSPSISTSVAGVNNYGPDWVEPITMYGGAPGSSAIVDPSRHALLASGNRVFIGGHTWSATQNDYVCPNMIWKYPYPDVSNGTTWMSCVDMDQTQWVKAFDLWNDTLLAVAFPKVTKVDTLNGTPMGTFDLFTGALPDNGHTCISGDTLFWASQFGGSQLHIGKYLINSGPIWEMTLPFAGKPVELHRDGVGRLWTAVGNNIIWIDSADGSYESYAYGLSVDAMDIIGTNVVITGTTDGTTSYILHAHIIP